MELWVWNVRLTKWCCLLLIKLVSCQKLYWVLNAYKRGEYIFKLEWGKKYMILPKWGVLSLRLFGNGWCGTIQTTLHWHKCSVCKSAGYVLLSEAEHGGLTYQVMWKVQIGFITDTSVIVLHWLTLRRLSKDLTSVSYLLLLLLQSAS